jgi:hypothetical protein
MPCAVGFSPFRAFLFVSFVSFGCDAGGEQIFIENSWLSVYFYYGAGITKK